MGIKKFLFQWYMIHGFHRLVQRERRAGMIQTTRFVHHMFIERRRDLARRSIVHRPHRPNHRMEPNELHRRREMDRLVQTLSISDSRMTCREIRKFRILQIAPDDPLDCQVSVVQSERRLEWLFPIWDTMTRKVDPFVIAKLLRLLSIYTRECSEAVDALPNVVQSERSSLSPATLA